jgi:hypothetical protein
MASSIFPSLRQQPERIRGIAFAPGCRQCNGQSLLLWTRRTSRQE